MPRRRFKAKVAVDGKRRTVEVTIPVLVGVTAAAEILGVPKPHISQRLKDVMPEAIEVEGSAHVWIKSEVEELARKRADGRNG